MKKTFVILLLVVVVSFVFSSCVSDCDFVETERYNLISLNTDKYIGGTGGFYYLHISTDDVVRFYYEVDGHYEFGIETLYRVEIHEGDFDIPYVLYVPTCLNSFSGEEEYRHAEFYVPVGSITRTIEFD